MTERGRSVLTWVLAIGLLWMAGVAGYLLRFKHNAMLYMNDMQDERAAWQRVSQALLADDARAELEARRTLVDVWSRPCVQVGNTSYGWQRTHCLQDLRRPPIRVPGKPEWHAVVEESWLWYVIGAAIHPFIY